MVVVGLLEVGLRLEECRSLKEKRSIVRPLIERLRNRFNASVCESGDQDLWGNCEIGVAIACSDSGSAERELMLILAAIEQMADFDMVVARCEVQRV